jgi:hypothetical protein
VAELRSDEVRNAKKIHRLSMRLIAIAFAGSGVVAHAQSEIPDDPRGSTYSAALDYQRPNQSFLAGVMPGEGGVAGGSATYTVPIQLPPGRLGLQPSVSLSYSSRAGNGVAGLGFTLNAGGAITRCPSTIATDGDIRGVKFDGGDKLCLNGQRLVVETGSYGAQDTVYRTEIDAYARVVQRGGTLSADSSVRFEVHNKDGSRHYYGADSLGSSARNARVKPAGAINNATMSWLLDTQLDRANNNVLYAYQAQGSGQNLLTQITYTGQGINAGDRSVQFTYEDRAD